MSCEFPDWCDEVERVCSGRAKKPLTCCECRGEIPKGRRYIEYKGVWSGDFEVYRFHKFCHNLVRSRDRYLTSKDGPNLYEDELPGFGQLISSTRDEIQESKALPPWWPKGLSLKREKLAEAALSYTDD
jgi:hypothetical protein